MVKKRYNLKVKGLEISIFQIDNSDYVSLTDMAKYKDIFRSDYILQNWIRGKHVIEFLGLWEKLYNKNFKPIEFDGFMSESGSNSFVLTPKKWIEKTNAIGIISRVGRGGGTYAHKDIAFEFASWISVEFKLYLIKEFQRLKEEEGLRLEQGWDTKRTLAKINYKIHTDSIKEHIIPTVIPKTKSSTIYANEADVLNVALFGQTAKDWRVKNPNKDGNIRDYANVMQLIILVNLESFNAELIRRGISQSVRLVELNKVAIFQARSLIGNSQINKIGKI
ncbi:MAG: hypothetical protein UX08_C0007G0039 [Candidatus Collierbacteria bacterium GW2011_GWB1_45_35]|uniref:KilA-N domain-containing protein n=1 Tax=Candidatus Collierbacteria bacterium GW2011_GWB2_45_17 TaxID=1618388 RepID=A0A837IMA6_9BACT|nr:MAG: hypothetical protein UW48_C0001G0071 [Microgenomates group bacterium GW2011_GWC1_44_23]KKT96191.1 MAG: hypothetical protein UW96_C0001G0069 [Candidatus Collierbacteria bacterium GW2011_GWA1_45_15]KKU01231.1 MAG: hypothetical protein UX01_C0001G0075 [Candidatus Collierbacteria bacterium GW2011_GWB2_45_17]KKU05342.1 MAG: hypothetical protein UX08_C0007G0039 [Candidatus Collierbacteria bacterium GW2011_GWB1_45_35]KKU08489.1 MAG: hypothetical protein UX11_C0003G0031 [Candidatus Collierbacte